MENLTKALTSTEALPMPGIPGRPDVTIAHKGQGEVLVESGFTACQQRIRSWAAGSSVALELAELAWAWDLETGNGICSHPLGSTLRPPGDL